MEMAELSLPSELDWALSSLYFLYKNILHLTQMTLDHYAQPVYFCTSESHLNFA